MPKGKKPSPNSVEFRDDVIIKHSYTLKRDHYKKEYKLKVRKYPTVKRQQPLNVNKYLALEALDRFFGYTGPAKFLMRQNDTPKKKG